jgi:hypothetical protein
MWGRFVSGHEFTHAERALTSWRFSPCGCPMALRDPVLVEQTMGSFDSVLLLLIPNDIHDSPLFCLTWNFKAM